jgi:hypothetical protein
MYRTMCLLFISLVIWSQLTGLSRSHFSALLVVCHETILVLPIFILLKSHYFLATLNDKSNQKKGLETFLLTTLFHHTGLFKDGNTCKVIFIHFILNNN